MTELQNHQEDPRSSPEARSEKPPLDDEQEGEIRLTIRKLEVPVRPRGVLAE